MLHYLARDGNFIIPPTILGKLLADNFFNPFMKVEHWKMEVKNKGSSLFLSLSLF